MYNTKMKKPRDEMEKNMSKDMCVACGDGILNIRAGAIIMKDGKLLMVGNDRDYLYSVGGRHAIQSEQADLRDFIFLLYESAR